jgi:hypothetical protein
MHTHAINRVAEVRQGEMLAAAERPSPPGPYRATGQQARIQRKKEKLS